MKPFASHMESPMQIRHSFCSRMLMATTIVLVFVMIGGLPQAALAQAPACPQTPDTIKECCNIDIPGKYSLGQNLTAEPEQGCIGIREVGQGEGNFYLNLDGHTISGSGPGRCLFPNASVGISVQKANVHIVGRSDGHGNKGTVTGFAIGIQVAPTDHNHFSDLTLTGNQTALDLNGN